MPALLTPVIPTLTVCSGAGSTSSSGMRIRLGSLNVSSMHSNSVRFFWRTVLAIHSILALTLIALCAVPTTVCAQAAREVVAKNGVVVSVSAEASDEGLAVLQRGGNAVDAAIVTAFVLAVTYPQAGNIGGGGFMMVHLAATSE